MSLEVIVSLATIFGFLLGYTGRKIFMAKKEENRFTNIEQSYIRLEVDVKEIKEQHVNCNIHAQKIATLESDYSHAKENVVKTQKDIENLYSITSDIRLDISDINVNIATIKENSTLRTEMMNDMKTGINKLLEKGDK